jgi:ribosomal protein S27E
MDTASYQIPEVTTNIITCPFCGADIYIYLDYQGQVFCWQCGKEIIR